MSAYTRILTILVGTAMAGYATLSHAEGTTLRVVSAFAENSLFFKNFEQFMAKVNAEGAGTLHLKYIGGPSALPPFEVGNAVRTGVIDMAMSSAAFYTSLVPEADAIKLAQVTAVKQRENGAYDLINKIWKERANMVYLGRFMDYTPFHIYLVKPIRTLADLRGMKLRSTPIYRDFFKALGASLVTTAPGEIYTALDRGAIDGYGWTIYGIFDLNLAKKTRYRIDPGFYSGDITVIMNLDKWNQLSRAQRDLLTRLAAAHESQNVTWEKINDEERRKQKEIGIQSIELSSDVATQYLDKAYEVGWEHVIKVSPKYGSQLRRLLSR
ncbi:MAG: TRAP transporter substrate-binding protein DctP [Burkholderiales bacterium]